jgi:hypothetical protein
MTRLWFAVLALAFALAAPPLALAEVRIYRPQHRLPAELEELAAGLMAGDGSALADPGTGNIVLKGPPALIEQALGVLTSLDVPLRSFTVESRLVRANELEALGVRASGWIRYGDLRVGRGLGGGGLRVSASDGRGSSRSSFASEVAVRDGGGADIWIGELRPETHTVLDESGRPARVVLAPEAFSRSGMRVEPRGLPDGSIELSIQQIVSHDRLDAPTEQTGARTQLRVQPDEWLVLGRTASGGVERERGLALHGAGGRARHGERSASDERLLLVRVRDASRPGDSGPRP